jgi:hypothetical protein
MPLKQLEEFKIQHNKITGPIPDFFGKMPNLRVIWLHHNDLSGQIPYEIGNSDSLVSFDVRYNPKLCGPLPKQLHVNWDRVWADTQKDSYMNWFGFCDHAASENSACGILATQVCLIEALRVFVSCSLQKIEVESASRNAQGTHVGRDCSTVNARDAACGEEYDQCGGSDSPVVYKGEVVSYDVYKGPTCCESDLICQKKDKYYSQCVPTTSTGTNDQKYDSKTDIGLLSKPTAVCANAGQQCGGLESVYNGPRTCCNKAQKCFQENMYYSHCI